jgi:hypothetical protein
MGPYGPRGVHPRFASAAPSRVASPWRRQSAQPPVERLQGTRDANISATVSASDVVICAASTPPRVWLLAPGPGCIARQLHKHITCGQRRAAWRGRKMAGIAPSVCALDDGTFMCPCAKTFLYEGRAGGLRQHLNKGGHFSQQELIDGSALRRGTRCPCCSFIGFSAKVTSKHRAGRSACRLTPPEGDDERPPPPPPDGSDQDMDEDSTGQFPSRGPREPLPHTECTPTDGDREHVCRLRPQGHHPGRDSAIFG